MKKPDLKRLGMAASALFWCALNLPAQTPPAITTQPASQTNLAGANVAFTVAVAGTGPFTCQWQFNGANLPNNIITTVAGGGSGGDGVFATNASLANPTGIAFDGFGNLYVADTGNQRIRKVDPSGAITTVAGNGGAGYSGDGSAATSASLHLRYPSGVALDASGNLYVADTGNQRIRKVDSNGTITTVRAKETMVTPGMADRRPMPVFITLQASSWMKRATSMSLTNTTSASARWTPTASSRRWRAKETLVTPGTVGRPPTPC